MSGEMISQLIWLVEILVIFIVSLRQLYKGVQRFRAASHGGERRLAASQIASGVFGLMAFMWFAALLFVVIFIFPTEPPPEVVCTECYARFRSNVNRVLLLGGFFFVILLIALPEFLAISLKRWWQGLSEEERDVVQSLEREE